MLPLIVFLSSILYIGLNMLSSIGSILKNRGRCMTRFLNPSNIEKRIGTEFSSDFPLGENFLQTTEGANFLLYLSVDGQHNILDSL
jgi:hypothetical protein